MLLQHYALVPFCHSWLELKNFPQTLVKMAVWCLESASREEDVEEKREGETVSRYKGMLFFPADLQADFQKNLNPLISEK